MRIVSLLASATEIVCALGAGEMLVGRSHECDSPEWVRRLPACSAPAFDVSVSSGEIDAEVRRRLQSGEPLYHIHSELIRELRADLLITQSHCEVCAVTPGDIERSGVCASPARQVALSASSLEEIFQGVLMIARELGLEQQGAAVVRHERERLDAVREKTANLRRPTVVMVEWTDPLFAMGNWGPELVTLAGGADMLGTVGQHSTTTPWEAVRAADPDVLVVAPCGFDLSRAAREMPLFAARPGWADLRAVRAGRVFVADGNLYFNRSGPTLFETPEILAELLHPAMFPARHEGSAWARWPSSAAS